MSVKARAEESISKLQKEKDELESKCSELQSKLTAQKVNVALIFIQSLNALSVVLIIQDNRKFFPFFLIISFISFMFNIFHIHSLF